MAAIILTAAGSALGAGFGGSILGFSGAAIGGAIGSLVGTVIDSRLAAPRGASQQIEGPRLDDLRVTSATEGAVLPRIYGRMRTGGNIIWATDFLEVATSTSTGGGKGQKKPTVMTTAYSYSASFATALCEGPIGGVGRIWADGKPFDVPGATYRVYCGTETQSPGPHIEARDGVGNAPAYRGTAYVVFEHLPLAKFGNRLPQLSFEVFGTSTDPASAEQLLRAVNIIPSAGEFVYATEGITRTAGAGQSASENIHSATGLPDFVASLDQLEVSAPNCRAASLVVSWFGSDLRAGNCQIRPGVETATKATIPKVWAVNGVERAAAYVVSQSGGKPVYGGTPADFAVVQAIQELKARGFAVTFYPFLLMDVPAGNLLPNPYSDNGAAAGQPALPWRGRITCAPAAGYAGTVDKTAPAGSQIAAFFGSAAPGNFAVSGTSVSWTGGTDWGLRRMILHYAHLCAAAGGVDAFLIGSELRGTTQTRDSASTYPGVALLRSLAADCRAILGAATKISYAADWSEYAGHQPADGSGDLFYNLDPLWADGAIDFVGIDNYLPLSDWRDGTAHLDAFAGAASVYDLAYLQGNIEGGEGFDWFYARSADRLAQIRTAISDGTYLEPWVYRTKDIRAWWSTSHHDRPAGVRKNLIADPGNPRAASWNSFSSAFTSDPLTSGPFVNAARISGGGVFGGTRKSAATPITAGVPYRVRAWVAAGNFANGKLNLNCGPISSLTSDARSTAGLGAPFVNITAAGSISALTSTALGGGVYRWDLTFTPSAGRSDLSVEWGPQVNSAANNVILLGVDVLPLSGSDTSATAFMPQAKPIRFTEAGCPAIDRGTNQPNVFCVPKSSESQLPYHSRGWRDETIQRRYLEAIYPYWSDPVHNPTSALYGGPMIDVANLSIWTWDARPFPDFPARGDAWGDGANWTLGHWLTGRIGGTGLAELVRSLCARGGLPTGMVDTSRLVATVPGFAVGALESARASIEPLARFFGFDGMESGGLLHFVPRGRPAIQTILPAGLVANRERQGEDIALSRGQETELPRALKWRLIKADEEFGGLTVEARRITVDTARTGAESFALARSQGTADRAARRALLEEWAGREDAAFTLPPSKLALDPTDAVLIGNDGRLLNYVVTRIADGEARGIEARRVDPVIYDLAPGADRAPSTSALTVFGPPQAVLLNLPQLSEDIPDWRPYAAVFARPWYGQAAVWRSATLDGFTVLDMQDRAAVTGVLVTALPAGPTGRFDPGNVLTLDLASGSLASVTDLELFAQANALALQSAPGGWEVIQFANAALIAPGRWQLSRLLRGQMGTEGEMAALAPTGSVVVILDAAVEPLTTTQADVGIAWNWRIGPPSAAAGDAVNVALTFTPTGRGQRPWSPSRLRGLLAGGDFQLSWVRRTRSAAGDSWVAPDVPLGEASEAYDLEILSGSTVVRSVAALPGPAFAYTATMMLADFGAPVAALRFRVFQIGALGRGAPAQADV